MVSLSSINKWILKPSIDRLNILKDDMWARSFNKKVSLGDKIGWSVISLRFIWHAVLVHDELDERKNMWNVEWGTLCCESDYVV